jgi:hypothetical protein
MNLQSKRVENTNRGITEDVVINFKFIKEVFYLEWTKEDNREVLCGWKSRYSRISRVMFSKMFNNGP